MTLNITSRVRVENCVEIVLKLCRSFTCFIIIFNQIVMNFCWTCVEIFYWFFVNIFLIIYIYHRDDDLLLSSSCWSTVIIKLHNYSDLHIIVLIDLQLIYRNFTWCLNCFFLLFKEYKNFNHKEFKFSQGIIKGSIHFNMSDS